MTYIPPLEGTATQMNNVPVSASGITFGYKCTDEKLVRLLQIEDTYFADLDLWLADACGERYRLWDFDDNGNIISGKDNGFEEMTDDEGLHHGAQRFYNFAFIPSSVLAWRQGGVGVENSRYEIYQELKDFPMIEPALCSVFSTPATLEYGTACGDIRDEYFQKCLVGDNDIDATWDNYVATWLAAGGQEMIDSKREMEASLQADLK